MKILVTGASGFLGRNLIPSLLTAGHNITAVSRKHIDHFCHDRFGQLNVDLLSDLSGVFAEGYDALLHIAAANDVYSRDYQYAFDHTHELTRNLLDNLMGRVKTVIYVSTAQVYGVAKNIDDSSADQAMNVYALTHLYAEKYVEYFCHQNRIPCYILRPTNVFGDVSYETVSRDTLVPACFCKMLAESNSISLNSSGQQSRNFVSTDSVFLAIKVILEGRVTCDKPCRLAVSSNLTLKIIDVARYAQQRYTILTGSSSVLNFNRNSRDDDSRVNYYSKRLAEAGYKPINSSLEDFLLVLDTLLIHFCRNDSC